MSRQTGILELGRLVGAIATVSPTQLSWTASLDGIARTISVSGLDLTGIFVPEETRFPRVDDLSVNGLNIFRVGMDVWLPALFAGGLIGTDFDDIFNGTGGGAVRLFLAHGNDSATGSAGSDVMYGGAGNDTLAGGEAGDLLDGGAGDDVFIVDGSDTLNGSDGMDTLAIGPPVGGDGSFFTMTTVRLGESFFDGYNSYDGTMLGNFARVVFSSIENVIGTSADEDIAGSSVANRLEGRGGFDLLDGLAGDDTLLGGDGGDALMGDAGADLLDGEAGDDTLWGGLGDDTLIGGAGIDTYVVDKPSFAFVQAAYDPVALSLPDADTIASAMIDLGAGTALYEIRSAAEATANPSFLSGTASLSARHTLSGIENAVGSDLSDSMRGSSDDNLLDGGGSGDILEGLAGNDTLVGGGGNDVLSGGSGFDTANFSSVFRPILVELWRGRAVSSSSGEDTLSGIERVVAGFGNDTLVGGVGADELRGEDGSDLIFGNAGNDTLWGGREADTLWGEAGNDRLFGDWANDMLLGGEGMDTLFGFFGDDSLYGWLGNDRLLGEQGNDSLFGEQGDDFLGGLEGNDFLIGGEGHDVIFGDDANDFLGGQAGNDILIGGKGNDTIWGDDGFDLFVFRRNDFVDGARDEVFDFKASGLSSDTLRFEGLDLADLSFIQLSTGSVAISITIGGIANSEVIVHDAYWADVFSRVAFA